MFTFIVVPHWSIMPHTIGMCRIQSHFLTLGRPVLAFSHINLSVKRGAASTIFNDMSRPGVEYVYNI